MLRKAFTVAVLALAGSTSLLATGCTSNNSSEKPYGLTGNTKESQLTPQERARYTDQKGRFHPEWVGQPGR